MLQGVDASKCVCPETFIYTSDEKGCECPLHYVFNEALN